MSSTDSTKKLFHLNSICGLLTFTGKDSRTFLNNLLISDLNSIPENKFIYSALCNPKGRIISSFWIKRQNQMIFMILPKENLALIDFFKMRTFRQDVQINSASDTLVLDVDTNQIKLSESNRDEVAEMDIDSYYQYLFKQDLPWIRADFSERFIPQHVNLDQVDDAMSFEKGCYPGQEIIARIKYLGTIKKKMRVFEFKTLAEAKLIYDDKKAVSPIVFNSAVGKYQFQSVEAVNN